MVPFLLHDEVVANISTAGQRQIVVSGCTNLGPRAVRGVATNSSLFQLKVLKGDFRKDKSYVFSLAEEVAPCIASLLGTDH